MNRMLTGLIPAALAPFDEDGHIDTGDLDRHLRYLAGVPGVTGITVNGHAGEVSSLSPDEQVQVLKTARDALRADQHLVAGVYAHSTREAVTMARLAQDNGADVLLIFPPEVWEFGVSDDPRLAIEYYRAIAGATGLPTIAFVYPTYSPLHLSPRVVLELCGEVEQITAVKDWSNDMVVYETTLRGLRADFPHVSMLSSYSRSLLGTLHLGADGILSGHASLIPELQAGLIQSVRDDDPDRAAELTSALFELTTAFYAPPVADGFTRMKYASVRLGRMKSDRVREPLLPLTDEAKAAIDRVLPTLIAHASDRTA